MKKVLIVAAHPDDEVLGCGATVARLVKERAEVYTLILGEGVTSRDRGRDRKRRTEEIKKLRKASREANYILGVKEVFFYDFPDNRFDSVDILDIIKVVEEIKDQIKPDIIFTHSDKDLNIDHRIVHTAVKTATRPTPGESVKELYAFEVLSSTEWNFPSEFSPNVYFDVSDFIGIKLEAMKAYYMELKDYPHPRSLEGIKIKAAMRGMEVGIKFAEAFEVVRIIQ